MKIKHEFYSKADQIFIVEAEITLGRAHNVTVYEARRDLFAEIDILSPTKWKATSSNSYAEFFIHIIVNSKHVEFFVYEVCPVLLVTKFFKLKD